MQSNWKKMNVRQLTGGTLLIAGVIAVVMMFVIIPDKPAGEKESASFWEPACLTIWFATIFLIWSTATKIVMIADKRSWPAHLLSLSCFCLSMTFLYLTAREQGVKPAAETLSLTDDLILLISTLVLFCAGPIADFLDLLYLWQTRRNKPGWRREFQRQCRKWEEETPDLFD